MQSDYLEYDAIGLADLVRRREVSARELLDTAIARAEATNPAINAIVLKDYEAARERARRIEASGNGVSALSVGPLAGVPFLVKDLGAAVAGLRMTFGSRHYRHYIPTADAPVVARFRAAGLNIFGKTSASELGQMPYTEPELFGPCRNPWSLDHTPGGSSGGAAASVAAGIVPLAHASDGGGSIRIPASCCGLFGFKPSRAFQPASDVPPPPGALGVDLAVSRSVRDSALMLDLIAGDPALPAGAPGTFLDAARTPLDGSRPLAIALLTEPMFADTLSPEVRGALDDAAELLTSLGHRVEPYSLPVDYAQAREAFLMLWSVVAEQYVLHADDITGTKPRRREFEIATWAMAHIGQKLGERELPAALDVQQRVTAQLAGLMKRYDVLLCPTLAAPPVKIGELKPNQSERIQMRAVTAMPVEVLMRKLLTEASNKAFAWAGCTELFNLTGQPSMSVPLAWNARGLPIGIQFAAREGNDALLLRLAAQLEAARPWFNRRPPLLQARL
ncbi:amidase [Paraburkholderia silvatlantica]|uniref:Amidase n=1 Tax=Paraburkholderia silvatlantica TaxID=321895 RepID=A0ABR6FII0_9BURK|nr:amidase [Paraburkholderia silvatlantica]MBB2927206.1 amidase [Paraburkholderia silvatlantica]PVY36927.1 amidase [Paraburkholderia silvatlantica]PXW41795.1 amidase [Paraburkholderia silvatlantica]